MSSDLDHIKEIEPKNKFTYRAMFDRYLYVKLGRKLLKVHYLLFTFMSVVEQTVSLLFKNVPKIPIVYQMVAAHKGIYKKMVLVYSVPCSFDTNRGSSLVVTHRTADVQVTSDRQDTP